MTHDLTVSNLTSGKEMQGWIVYTWKTLANRKSSQLPVSFETRHTPVVTQIPSTVNANNLGLAERTIRQDFEA